MGPGTDPAASPAAASPACVVDVRLMLGRHGLQICSALSRCLELWLPQALHELVRARPGARPAGALAPRERPGGGADPDLRAAEVAEVADELALWDLLPQDAALAALPLYHLGARADECRVPPSSDGGLRRRCELLQQGLDLLAVASGREVDELASCHRDAAALCAALLPYGAFVLTRLEPGGAAPALCECLEAWDLRAEAVAGRGGPVGAQLRAALVRAGLLPLVWAGLRLALVHVVLPGVALLGAPDPRLDAADIASRWSLATVYWHEV
jgi:hypothetical protein